MAEKILNIVAVDDEPSVLFALSFALATPTLKLTRASDGEDALKQIAAGTSNFDIVITDNKHVENLRR